VEYLLPQPTDRRPAAETVDALRMSCDAVLARGAFASTFEARMADLVPPDDPLRSPEIPLAELAVAVLDPVRDPDRYGGALDHVEARWQQLGAWLADLGMPDESCHHLVRAVARAARDVSGEEWDSTASSAWAALQLWMQDHLGAGVEQVRGPAPASAPAPPGGPASGQASGQASGPVSAPLTGPGSGPGSGSPSGGPPTGSTPLSSFRAPTGADAPPARPGDRSGDVPTDGWGFGPLAAVWAGQAAARGSGASG